MLTRRYLTFMANLERVSGKSPHVYLWTFTLPTVVELEIARKKWNLLLTYLRRWNPRWRGIRVFEMHPGKWGYRSHGLHVHVVTDRRFDLTSVLSIVRSCGWGRTHVCKVPASQGAYVGKYLQKKRMGCFKGWRLCACFGLPDWSRLRDLVLDCPRSRLFRMCKGMTDRFGTPWASMPWHHKLEMVAQADWTRIANNWVWDPIGQYYHDPRPRKWAYRCITYDQGRLPMGPILGTKPEKFSPRNNLTFEFNPRKRESPQKPAAIPSHEKQN